MSEQNRIIPFQEAEKRILIEAIRLTKGNISKAARGLHIARATLYRKINKYGIDKKWVVKTG